MQHAFMEILKTWRETQGISVAEAASQVGVDRVSWWRWETGALPVGVKNIPAVSKKTGIPPQKLRPDVFGEAQV